jgi:hypothetical protein
MAPIRAPVSKVSSNCPLILFLVCLAMQALPACKDQQLTSPPLFSGL